MEDHRLRRCIPLKIAAHVLMFFAFLMIIGAVIFGILFINFALERNDSQSGQASGNGYFRTETFYSDYCGHLNGISSLLNVWADHNAYGNPVEMELWRNIYLDDYVNFQYAIYDTEGELLAQSPDFDRMSDGVSASGATAKGRIFYYSNDLSGLKLYDVEEQTAPGNGIVGSNFMPWSWYVFDTGGAGTNIGYIYTYVPEQLEPGDSFYFHSQVYAFLRQWDIPVLIIGITAVIVFLICFVYTLLAAGWRRREKEVRLLWFDKIYTEIAAAIIALLLFLMGTAVVMVIGLTVDGRYMGDIAAALCLLVPAYMAGMFGIYSLVRRGKAHNYISQSLIYKLCHGVYRVIYQGMINNHLMRKYISVVLGLGIADFILFLIAMSLGSVLFFLVILGLFIGEFIYVGRKLMAIQEIAKGAEAIVSGHLDYKIDTSDMGSGVFLEFANNINNIGQGLNRAVDESIKSERMKADLITNVSHDIKTPLTSIINYVDLLKRLNITDEPAKEYIDILDSKSQRLKMLIEDLVEASRASSGNITLERSNIEFNELVQQVAGTYVEKYEQRQLSLVLHTPQEPLMIYADGRRMYRVLDNLFNNAFKYAMPGSRVYIDLYEQDEKACFVMKNISEAPLNISAEELTQRFVRGDASRTTEGSGLGLSIAQSLVELHGGSFKLHLDGDLFKAVILLPETGGGASGLPSMPGGKLSGEMSADAPAGNFQDDRF